MHQTFLPAISQTGPCVATRRVSERTRRTSTEPWMPCRRSARGSGATIPARRAVAGAARARGSAAPARVPSRRGLIGAQQHRARLDVVARVELDLAVEVAPVGRQPRERRLPRVDERATGSRLGARARSARCVPASSSVPAERASSSRRRRRVIAVRARARCRRGRRRSAASSASARNGCAGASSAAARSAAPRSPQFEAQLGARPAVRQPRLQLRQSPTRLTAQNVHCRRRGQGREEARARRGDAARVPARDAAHPALRGEGRGALPRRRAARLPARRDRPGGGRGRRLPGDGGRRRLRLDPSRARAHARARHAPERAHGRAVREDRGLLARLRRLDAPLRRRARQPRRERRRRRRPARRHRRRASPSSCATSRASRVAFFGDGATNIGTFHESLNLAQLWKTKTRLRLREQPLGRVDAGLAALAGLGRHVASARSPTTCARDQGRRPGRRGGLRGGARGARVRALRRTAPSSSTSRPTACTATTSATRRSTARRRTATRRPSTIRSRACASGSGSTDEEFEALDDEAHEIVEAAVEFAKNGTDPQPEDALKNVYA